MTATNIQRQGDILIVPIDAPGLPLTPVAAEGGRHVLAYGEATGHHHSIAFSDRVAMFREDGSGGGLFLSVTGEAPVALEHQEHSTLLIPPGAYEVRQQREYSPAEIRRVVD